MSSTSMYEFSGKCPVCGDQMHIVRLECGNCNSALEGKFVLNAFSKLTTEQLQFLEVFIRCRGQNKAIQELLNISYPTVNKKLDEIILSLGFEPENREANPEERRRDILEQLSQNKITSAQAQQLLAAVRPAGE